MARPKTITALIVVFTLSAVVIGLVLHKTWPVDTDTATRAWQMRAEATADNPRAARQVIVDSIYANKTLVVAEAYEKAMQQKPTREARIANFAHAVEVANHYSDAESTNPASGRFFDPNINYVFYKRAQDAVKSIIQRPDDASLHTDIEFEEAKNFKPTQIADAWLAWANFSGDSYQSYQHAIKLDPNFGEAYFEEVQQGALYRTNLPAKTKYALAVRDLDRAERLEPALHPLITNERYLIALKQGNRKAAIAYLQEALRSWPTAPNADAVRQQLAYMEATEKKHDAT